MEQMTHKAISPELVGRVESLEEGRSRVSLVTSEEMCADERGLVHGGFAFGLADYAAMVAVNDPNVVLGASEVRFTAPVRLGDTMVAEASVESRDGKKVVVSVEVAVGVKVVLKGAFTTFVLEKHILD